MLRTKPETLDTYLVFDAEDPLNASLCRGEAETREIIDQFDCTAGLQVLRVTLGELTRDVTADFLPDDDAAPEVEFTIRDHTRAMARSGAFGGR
jgi:hypothetical protein